MDDMTTHDDGADKVQAAEENEKDPYDDITNENGQAALSQ